MKNQTIDVYHMVKEKILNGEYLPSASLTETDLSNQFGVSRNTVKKVLLMLEKENLVTITLNKSAKVRAFTSDEVLKYLEVREVLEGLIVKKVVEQITDEQIAKLENILKMMESNLQNKELLEYSKYNQLFHSLIYEACPNEEAVNITITLKNQISKYNMKTILIPGRDVQSFTEHSAILNAIKRKDAESAEVLMRNHISNIRKMFRDHYTLLF